MVSAQSASANRTLCVDERFDCNSVLWFSGSTSLDRSRVINFTSLPGSVTKRVASYYYDHKATRYVIILVFNATYIFAIEEMSKGSPASLRPLSVHCTAERNRDSLSQLQRQYQPVMRQGILGIIRSYSKLGRLR